MASLHMQPWPLPMALNLRTDVCCPHKAARLSWTMMGSDLGTAFSGTWFHDHGHGLVYTQVVKPVELNLGH